MNGTDAIAAGSLEQDVLTGGLGADTFILGDVDQVYYGTQGDADHVTIMDFDASIDIVQPMGSAANYSQQSQGNKTHLYLIHTNSPSYDLIAVFDGVDTTDLTNHSFNYV